MSPMVEEPSVAVQHGNQLLVGNVDSRVDAVRHAVCLRPESMPASDTTACYSRCPRLRSVRERSSSCLG